MSTALTIGRGHQAWPLLHGWHVTHRVTRRQHHVLPALAAHERVLGRLDLLGGGVVIGTQRALYLGDGDTGWRRIGWVDVASAGWSRDSASMVLRLWPVEGEPAGEVQVPSGTGFAAFAAERVCATQLLCRRVQLTPTTSATITALRETGVDGIRWQVRLHDHADSHDPAVTIAAKRALADLRSIAGC